MADNSVTTIGSALIPLINAQQQRALTFPPETKELRVQARPEKNTVSSTLSDDERGSLNGRAAGLSRDDDLSGYTTRVRQAVQAYQTQAVDAEREQISRLMGIDTFA